MLEEVERDPPIGIQGDYFAVNKGAGRELLAGMGDIRELLREKVSSPRPERYPRRIASSKTAVAIELDLVEPFLPLRQLVDQSRIHRLDEADFGERQRAEGFGSHKEWRQ
jgi:hypothetical protein